MPMKNPPHPGAYIPRVNYLVGWADGNGGGCSLARFAACPVQFA